MITILRTLWMAFFLHSTVFINAQVGIGTPTPDSSAVLELISDQRGFLMPRLSTLQRDAITNPATGLLLYNNTLSEVQVNTGTPALPVWIGMRSTEVDTASTILSVTSTGDIMTSSTSDEVVTGMSLTPPAGTYLVLFNAQYGEAETEPISTVQAAADLLVLYNALMAMTATNTSHAPVFGGGETLIPGVYDLAGAASIAGTVNLDGGGDTNSVFVIRVNGAFAAGAITNIVLLNGAKARNIFWVAEGALSLGAGTIMKGTLIAHAGAVSAAAGTDLVGRMLAIVGAISFGPGTAIIPSGNSVMDLGVLSSFVMFSSSGAVSNTNPSTITGDVGTNLGVISGFEMLNGNTYGPGQAPPEPSNTATTFSIYQNSTLVPNSERTIDFNTTVVTLQALVSVTEGQSIEVRWKVDVGAVMLGNRILSLVNSY